jgi:hypothetical protein
LAIFCGLKLDSQSIIAGLRTIRALNAVNAVYQPSLKILSDIGLVIQLAPKVLNSRVYFEFVYVMLRFSMIFFSKLN